MTRLEDNLFRLTGALARIGGYEPALEGIFGGGEQLETPPEREERDHRPDESGDALDPSLHGADRVRAQRAPCRPDVPAGRLHENPLPQDSRARTLLHTPTRPDGQPSLVSVAGKKWRTAETRAGSTRPAASVLQGRQVGMKISGTTSTASGRSHDANLPRGQNLPTP